MKKIYYTLAALALLTLPGCFEDTGNYNYSGLSEVSPGEITGIEESYSVIMLDNLQIKPHIENEKPGYEYEWYVYVKGNETRVIGSEKELNSQITLTNGSYHMVFRVFDPEHGTSSFYNTTLNVITEYTQGFYVLKDKDGETDIDFFKLDGEKYDNILTKIHGKGMPGQAVGGGLLMNGYHYQVGNDDGTVSTKYSQSAFFVLSSEDVNVYDANNMSLIKPKEEFFFEMPEVIAPQKITVSWSGVYLINNGRLHVIDNQSFGIGMMSYHFPGDNDLAPFLVSGGYKNGLVFDQRTSSFMEVKPGGSSFIRFTGASPVPCENMECDLIFMDEQESGDGMLYYSSMGILKSRTSDDYFAFRVYNTTSSFGVNPFSFHGKIPDECRIRDAKALAANNSRTHIYFSTGDNKVSYYSLGTRAEKELETDIPDDEKITYIRHLRYAYITPAFDVVAVVTSNDNGWKMYLYNIVTGTSDVKGRYFDEPLSGDGAARFVMYRNINSRYMN